jgi:hypothetical protein
LREKFNPRNINHMPVEDPEPLIGAVKFFVRLDLNQICLFLDGHLLIFRGILMRFDREWFVVEMDSFSIVHAIRPLYQATIQCQACI